MELNPVGQEFMGRKSRKRKAVGSYKFKKSNGANSAEKRFGFEQGQIAPPKRNPNRRIVGLRPLGRSGR